MAGWVQGEGLLEGGAQPRRASAHHLRPLSCMPLAYAGPHATCRCGCLAPPRGPPPPGPAPPPLFCSRLCPTWPSHPRASKTPRQQFCRKVKPGERRLANCLLEQMRAAADGGPDGAGPRLSASCARDVYQFLEAISANVNANLPIGACRWRDGLHPGGRRGRLRRLCVWDAHAAWPALSPALALPADLPGPTLVPAS